MRLLIPDPEPGAGAAPARDAADVTHQAATVAPVAHPSPPPAAQTVLNGEVTEETLRLREQLAASEAARKKVEQDHAAVTDEFTRYRTATEQPTPVPVVKRPARSTAKPEKSFRLGRFV